MTAVDVDALDKLREALAAALETAGVDDWAARILLTAALLPVVDRIATERAAAELEFAAVGLRDAPAEAAWLRTRATALRASNGEQR